jgi:predicted transcriptional regulator
MKSVKNNAITILKAMVEGSQERATGDAIKKLTNLRSCEINDAVLYLIKKNLVKPVEGVTKIRYDFLNITVSSRGYEFYSKNYCGFSME